MVFLTLDKTNKIPLYKQISNQLRMMIATKEISHLTLLPSEKEFQLIYNVSEIVVKRAYKILEEENLIKRVKGSGTFVVNREKMSLSLKNVDIVIDAKGFNDVKAKILNIQKTDDLDDDSMVLEDDLYDVYKVTQLLIKNNVPISYQNMVFSSKYYDYMNGYLHSPLNISSYVRKTVSKKATIEYYFNAANSDSLHQTIFDIPKGTSLMCFKAIYYSDGEPMLFVQTIYPGEYFELETVI